MNFNQILEARKMFSTEKTFHSHCMRFIFSYLHIYCCYFFSASLTLHAVQANHEIDEALQCHVSRGGAIAQSHQTEHVIWNLHSWRTHTVRLEEEFAYLSIYLIALLSWYEIPCHLWGWQTVVTIFSHVQSHKDDLTSRVSK